jgi:hypothetical protein
MDTPPPLVLTTDEAEALRAAGVLNVPIGGGGARRGWNDSVDRAVGRTPS